MRITLRGRFRLWLYTTLQGANFAMEKITYFSLKVTVM
jgi:hypothetical protein